MNSVTNTHKKARKNVGGVRPFSSRASGRHAGIAAQMRKSPDCLKAVHLKKIQKQHAANSPHCPSTRSCKMGGLLRCVILWQGLSLTT